VKKYIFYLSCFIIINIAFSACTNVPSFQGLSGEKITLNSNLSVFIFLNTECPICQKYQGEFKSLKLGSTPAYYVFPGIQKKDLIKEMCAFDSINSKQVILDPDFRLTRQLKANTTPEAIIMKDNQICYRGLIDDRFTTISDSKAKASINYLENTLNSLRKNEAIKIPYTKAVGCFIEPN